MYSANFLITITVASLLIGVLVGVVARTLMAHDLDHPAQSPRETHPAAKVTFGAVSNAGNFLMRECHRASYLAGWWSDVSDGSDIRLIIRDPKSRIGKAFVAEKLCLVHSEVSEAMEGARKDRMDDKLPHRKMIEVELADALIRIGDLAGALDLDLGGAIAEKMAFNAVRPDHKLENRKAEGGKAY